MNHRKHIPTTYGEALTTLAGRQKRTIANNTRLQVLDDGAIGLWLHATCIVTFRVNGTIVLNTGGWQTVTTKDRLNRVARAHGWSVYAVNREWRIAHRSGAEFEFEDGWTIPPARREPETAHVTAVVKGDKFTAAREAAKRRIPAVFVRETGNGHETVIRTAMKHWDAIACWFGEHGDCLPGRGFPDGTCLIFSTHEAEQPSPDARVSNHGSVCLLRPLTDALREHLEENVSEDAQWFGGALVVEPRYLLNLVSLLREAGFVVEAA